MRRRSRAHLPPGPTEFRAVVPALSPSLSIVSSKSYGSSSKTAVIPQSASDSSCITPRLVKYVAGRVGVGLPPNIEQADLVSYGIFGLIDAIEKFDLSRAIKFETYAISRIKGAIIDELRSIDWIPRSIRSKAREVERAYAGLEARLHRTPTEPEVAAELGIGLDDLHAIFGQVSFVNVLALDELLNVNGEKGDKVSLVDTLEDTRVEDPVRAFESQETKHLLARAINLLPEREKIVVTLYYYEGLTLAEIGQVLGVTESRICQMHTKAVLQLRAKLADQRG